MNIYEKLAAARKHIRENAPKKEGHNSYSAYDYFTPEQVEALVAKACEEVKAICLTSLSQDQYGYYQVLKFVDLEDTSEKSTFLTFELRTEKPEIKATNATQQMGGMDTYSERYIKMKVFQIKDNNLDFDSQDNRKVYPTKSQHPEQFDPKRARKAEVKGIARDEAEHDAGAINDFNQEL